MFIFTTQGGKKGILFLEGGEGWRARREGSVFALLCGVWHSCIRMAGLKGTK